MSETLQRRSDDGGWLCWTARRAGQFWDFVDKRDIDKMLVSVVVLTGTVYVTHWAMRFAEHGDRPGLEVAAIIAAVSAPYMALQAAAISFYFRARQ